MYAMATQSNYYPRQSKLSVSLNGFQEKLRNNLYTMWQTSQFCDLTLKLAGYDEIHVHSCLLAAFSPTIADVLSKVDTHFQEKGEYSQKYITLDVKKFSVGVMRAIVSSVYTGQLVFGSTENLGQLLDACRWLKIEDLTNAVEKAMGEDNCKDLMETGKIESSFSGDTSGPLYSPVGFLSTPSLGGDKDSSMENPDRLSSTNQPPSQDLSCNSNMQMRFISGEIRYEREPCKEAASNKNASSCHQESSDLDHFDSNLMTPKIKTDTEDFPTSNEMMLSNNNSAILGHLTSSEFNFQEPSPKKLCGGIGIDLSSSAQNNSSSLNGSAGDETPVSKTNFDLESVPSLNAEMGQEVRKDDLADGVGDWKDEGKEAAPLSQQPNESGNKRKRAKPRKNTNMMGTSMEAEKLQTTFNKSSTSSQNDVVHKFSGDDFVRKGTRLMKLSKKWAENFLANCLYSHEKTFLEAVVPKIKTEVDDLASYLNLPISYQQGLSGAESSQAAKQDGEKTSGQGLDVSAKIQHMLAAFNDDDSDCLEPDDHAGGNAAGPSSSTYLNDSLSLLDYYNKQGYTGNDGKKKSSKKKGEKAAQKKKRKSTGGRVGRPRKNATPKSKEVVETSDTEELGDVLQGNDDEDGDIDGGAKEDKKKEKKEKSAEPADADSSQGVNNYGRGKRKRGKPKKTPQPVVDLDEILPAINEVTGKRKYRKRMKKPKLPIFTTRVADPEKVSAYYSNTDSKLTSDIPVGDLDADEMKRAEEEVKKKIANGEPVKCVKCGVYYSDMEQYKEHVTNHPIFQCPDCPAKFYLKHPMTRHRYAVHFAKSYLRCQVCSFQAKTAKELCTHSGAEHNQPKPFKCDEEGCSRLFSKYSDMQRHYKEIHSNQYEYFCEKCGAGYRYKALYKYHLQRCLKNETHLCYKCGAVFHAKADLTHHISTIHFNIRKYHCPHCDHRFSTHSNLKRHLYIHNNVYPFVCTHCGKQFRHSNSFKVHMKNKHNGDAPSCSYNSNNTTGNRTYNSGNRNRSYNTGNRSNYNSTNLNKNNGAVDLIKEDAKAVATLSCMASQEYTPYFRPSLDNLYCITGQTPYTTAPSWPCITGQALYTSTTGWPCIPGQAPHTSATGWPDLKEL